MLKLIKHNCVEMLNNHRFQIGEMMIFPRFHNFGLTNSKESAKYK